MQENRQSWAEATGVHLASEFYDLDGFLNGNSTLHDFELDELGPVVGIDFDSKYSYFFDPEGYTVDDDRDDADPKGCSNTPQIMDGLITSVKFSRRFSPKALN